VTILDKTIEILPMTCGGWGGYDVCYAVAADLDHPPHLVNDGSCRRFTSMNLTITYQSSNSQVLWMKIDYEWNSNPYIDECTSMSQCGRVLIDGLQG
jgi:hypothetical protein